MKKYKIMSVFGTRPEAIKMAPLVKELSKYDDLESICCLTGQHREMLDSVMEIFKLQADFDLNIMEKRQTLSTITTKTLLGMERVMEQCKPDMILVHGDTSTTFAGALAAFYHQVPVGHVEAGLRTYDKYSPFPEEMNRTLVGDIADLHFSPPAPTPRTSGGSRWPGKSLLPAIPPSTPWGYTVKADRKFQKRAIKTGWILNTTGSSPSPATAGRTTASPWRISCPPLPRWCVLTRMWRWSTRCT